MRALLPAPTPSRFTPGARPCAGCTSNPTRPGTSRDLRPAGPAGGGLRRRAGASLLPGVHLRQLAPPAGGGPLAPDPGRLPLLPAAVPGRRPDPPAAVARRCSCSTPTGSTRTATSPTSSTTATWRRSPPPPPSPPRASGASSTSAPTPPADRARRSQRRLRRLGEGRHPGASGGLSSDFRRRPQPADRRRRRPPRPARTSSSGAGTPTTIRFFWRSYGYGAGPAPSAPRRRARPRRPRGLSSAPAYRPSFRPTLFASRTIGGAAGVGKQKPSGFGRVSVRMAGGPGHRRGRRQPAQRVLRAIALFVFGLGRARIKA